jgi:glycosyltransferase 2 family protein
MGYDLRGMNPMKSQHKMNQLKSFFSSIPWGVILKILVSGIFIAWLLKGSDWAKVKESIQHIHWGIVLIVLGIIWLTLVAIAKRWQLIIELGGIKAPFSRVTEATFIGACFNQFLPSSVGGDFYRIIAARRFGATLNESITGVFLDRLFGFLSLGVLCLLVVPLEGKVLLESDLKWPFIITIFLLICAFIGGLVLLLIPQRWHSLFFIRPFHPMIEVIRQSISQKQLFICMFLSSLVASILVILGLQILMICFDIPITWGQGVAILPVVMLLTSIPISFAGWGLREKAIVVAFGAYGVPLETSLALSVVYGVLQLISAIPGMALWLMEKNRMKTPNPIAQPSR